MNSKSVLAESSDDPFVTCNDDTQHARWAGYCKMMQAPDIGLIHPPDVTLAVPCFGPVLAPFARRCP
jgi:hypothetical protein